MLIKKTILYGNGRASSVRMVGVISPVYTQRSCIITFIFCCHSRVMKKSNLSGQMTSVRSDSGVVNMRGCCGVRMKTI